MKFKVSKASIFLNKQLEKIESSINLIETLLDQSNKELSDKYRQSLSEVLDTLKEVQKNLKAKTDAMEKYRKHPYSPYDINEFLSLECFK